MNKALSLEQKQYIKEHPTESAFTMARKFGCTENAVYYWLRMYYGDTFLDMKKEDRKYKIELIRKLYPTTSAADIGVKLGLTRAAVCHIAKRIGVKHTEETIKMLHKKNAAMSHTKESNMKRSASLKKRSGLTSSGQ